MHANHTFIMSEYKHPGGLDPWLVWLLQLDTTRECKIKALERQMKEGPKNKYPSGLPTDAIDLWLEYQRNPCPNIPEIVFDILEQLPGEWNTKNDEMYAQCSSDTAFHYAILLSKRESAVNRYNRHKKHYDPTTTTTKKLENEEE
jgi:hypothetical protein